MADSRKSRSASPIILTVGDEPAVLTLIGAALRRAGYVLITADTVSGLSTPQSMRPKSTCLLRTFGCPGGLNSGFAFLSKLFAIAPLLMMVHAVLGEEKPSASASAASS
jgi:hypothetical protein